MSCITAPFCAFVQTSILAGCLMKFTLLQILSIVGSLGLFIFGMKVMSEAIQKVAGSRMRQVLGAMAANRYRGVLSGFFITALIQSSSATTVLLVSFVNAGMLSLTESIGVIMGANIGTTFTAWLISILGMGKFSISMFSIPVIAFFLPLLFIKRQQAKLWAEVGIGFAILFLGLQFMQEFMPNIEENPQILEFLSDYDYHNKTGLARLGTTLLFVCVGFLVTIMLQSSSAASAITLVLCSQGWISLSMAVALVIGENIGTTITANIASLVANVHAKRTARAHLLFNLIGALWVLILFQPAVDVSSRIAQWITGLDPKTQTEGIPVALAVFHTSFNTVNVILLLGFVGWLARAVTRLTPSKQNEDEVFTLDYIGRGLMDTPELSIVEARKELVKFGDLMRRSFRYIPLLVTEMDEKRLKSYSQKLQKYEDVADRMEMEISAYLNNASKSELSLSSIKSVRQMLQVASYLERIGDKYLEISKNLQTRKEQKAYFTQDMRDRIMKLSDQVRHALDLMVKNLEQEENPDLETVRATEEEIDQLYSKYRTEHIKKVETGKYKIQSGMYYSDLIADMERIADHAASISFSMSNGR